MILLTKTEHTILSQVKLGLTTKEIAYKLSTGDGTVRFHLYNIYKKYGTKNRSELISLAHREQIIECPNCSCKLVIELGLADRDKLLKPNLV